MATFDAGDGREFIIEVKVRPSRRQVPSSNEQPISNLQDLNITVSPARSSPSEPRRSVVYLDPLEETANTTSRPQNERASKRSAAYIESENRESQLDANNTPIPRNLSRRETTESRATNRISKRMSRASETFYAAAEYNGWGDPRQGQGFRRLDAVDIVDENSASLRRPSYVEMQEQPQDSNEDEKRKAKRYNIKFYLILFSLCITSLLVALEGTVTSTALPTIVRELGGGASYVWASSGYFLASTVLQPLYGQMANIFGRRVLILFAVCSFVLGSGISGGAHSMGILIFGRVIQGIGGGGINMLVNLIVCDLVPLIDRGKFMALVFSAISVGTGLGPFLGGIIVERTAWRWVFYLNIPIGGISIVLLFFFLRVKTPKTNSTWQEKLAQIDIGGNILFITGVSFILVALTYAGTLWPWKSYNTIVTLLFGFSGLAVFLFYEESSYCIHPTMPLRLFRNRTSAGAFAITFIHSLLTLLVIYFLPVYLQAVLLSTPTRSGVQMLPTVIVLVPFSAISGAVLSKIGRYKPLHIAGFGIITVGLGCFITLNHKSPPVAWIMVQMVVAVGSGFSLSTLLPAVQAELSDADTAAATATWAFVRQFGVVWGISVPAAIFNSQITHLLPRISDATVRAELSGGAAYDHGIRAYINAFEQPLKAQIIGVYSDSLKIVWIFATAIAGLGFLLVFLERETKLRSEQSGDFGLDDD